jgi:hypothetical protein
VSKQRLSSIHTGRFFRIVVVLTAPGRWVQNPVQKQNVFSFHGNRQVKQYQDSVTRSDILRLLFVFISHRLQRNPVYVGLQLNRL